MVTLRSIDPILKNKLLSSTQTVYEDSELSVRAIVSRARTPITDKRYWQESIISADTTVTDSSVTVMTHSTGNTIYAAQIVGTKLTVKKAKLSFDVSSIVWETIKIVEGCTRCALQSVSNYKKNYSGFIERVFDQTEKPFLAYTTQTGEVYFGPLNDFAIFEKIINAGVTELDLVQGVESVHQDISQGIVLFYVIDGKLYYKQYINFSWTDQIEITAVPNSVIDVHAEVLFDYRICLQVKDVSGALWEVMTKMEASSWNNQETIRCNLSQSLATLPIVYSDFCDFEHISVNVTQILTRLYALSPVMVYAENRDNGIGDYGRVVRLVFDENIFGEQDNIGRFSLHDSSSGSWAAQSIARVNSKTLDITFLDFNNAVNPVVVAYTPGTMTGDIEPLDGDTIWFTADNLVPFDIKPPVPMSASNLDQKTIEIAFDKPISSPDWSLAKNGFTVTSYEYNRIPDGSLLPVTYVVTSVEQGATDSIIVKLTAAGRMKYPSDEVVVYYSKATGNLVGDLDAQVDNFEVDFVADVEYPVFNPNDVERISASVSQTVVNRLVTYISVKEEEYVSVGLTQTNIVYHVNDIPT
jgi:hypothetical protein